MLSSPFQTPPPPRALLRKKQDHNWYYQGLHNNLNPKLYKICNKRILWSRSYLLGVGLEFSGLGPVKIEPEHPIVGFDSLEALLDERRHHRRDVGLSHSKLKLKVGRSSPTQSLLLSRLLPLQLIVTHFLQSMAMIKRLELFSLC